MNNTDKKHQSWRLYLFLGLVFLFFGMSSAVSCPIPVFQYALENWDVDMYKVVVYHHGNLSEQCRNVLDLLEESQNEDNPLANIKVIIHDTSKAKDIELPVDADSLPYMQVFFPKRSRLQQPVWSGDFCKANVEMLLESPMRKQIGDMLLDRKTAVWVLIHGNDKQSNDLVYDLLKKELSRLEQTLVLPSSAEWQDQTVQIYDKISFEIVRLDRSAPDEQMLIKMLLASEVDLVEFGEVPIVFPIYGRGLILYALVNKGINSWTINEAANFLAGPCSCQIKAGNPGLDLLMWLDWQNKIEPLAGQTSAAPVGAGSFIRQQEKAKEELNDE